MRRNVELSPRSPGLLAGVIGIAVALEAGSVHADTAPAPPVAPPSAARSPWVATASFGAHGAVSGLRLALDRTVAGPITVGGAVWGGLTGGFEGQVDDYIEDARGGGAAASIGVRAQRSHVLANLDVSVGVEHVRYGYEVVPKRQLGFNAEVAGRLLAGGGPVLVGFELRVRLPGVHVDYLSQDGKDLTGVATVGAGIVVGGRW